MKKLLLAVAVLLGTGSAFAQNVGVSISVGQPGFYGRIDIGADPQPQVIYQQPMIVQPAPIGVVRQPIYLYVPVAYTHDWRRYCGRYNACNQPVYFVPETWYRNVYVPHHYPQYRPQGRYDQRPVDVRRDDHRRDNDRRDDHRNDNRGNDRHEDHRDGR